MKFQHRLTFPAMLAVAFILFGMGTAHAGLLGYTMGVEMHYPAMGTVCCGSYSAVVGPGVEFAEGSLASYNDLAYVDISDFQIVYGQSGGTYYSTGAFNGLRFYDVLGAIDPITGVSINGATTLAGFDLSRIFFDADNIYINLTDLSPSAAHIVSLDVRFDGGVASVPEPTSILLLGSGLLGLGLLRRRFTGMR